MDHPMFGPAYYFSLNEERCVLGTDTNAHIKYEQGKKMKVDGCGQVCFLII